MNIRISRACAAAAFTTAAVLGSPLAAAHADEPTVCPSAEELSLALDAADQVKDEAKAMFKASLNPLGKHIKVFREELKADVKETKAGFAALRKALKDAQSDEEAAALQAQLDEVKAALRENRSLLEKKKALKAELKDLRDGAKASWKDAKVEYQDVKALAEYCMGGETVEEAPEDEAPEDEAPEEEAPEDQAPEDQAPEDSNFA